MSKNKEQYIQNEQSPITQKIDQLLAQLEEVTITGTESIELKEKIKIIIKRGKLSTINLNVNEIKTFFSLLKKEMSQILSINLHTSTIGNNTEMTTLRGICQKFLEIIEPYCATQN